MLEKDGEITYIKYKDVNYLKNVFSIISLIILCFFVSMFFSKIESEYVWLNIVLQSYLAKIILITGIIIFLGISIPDILFYSNYDYHINIKTKKIHLINGRRKYKKEIILDFEQIKNIVLFKCVNTGEGRDIYTFKIDIYDNELNAYEIYESKMYVMVKKIALEIEKITKIKMIDRTDIDNYEGFIKRLL